MIDFRYHLVSLVSVFLALAVGIVLGAGPLKGEIGDQLTTQVRNLRAEADDLRTQLKTAQGAVDNRDTFTRDVLPQLAAGQLTGQSVVVVTVPGIQNDAVKPLTDALREAGATVSGQVDVKDAWTDPARAADREALVKTLNGTSSASAAGAAHAAVLPGPAPSPTPTVAGATGANTALATLLARAIVTGDPGVAGHPDRTATDLLGALAKAGLIGVDGELTGRATEAVLLVPAVQAVSGNVATPTPTPSIDPVAQWSALAVGLDANADGAVVAGPASSATTGGVIAAIRGQDAVTRLVSTVDTGGTPMGDLTTVLALREQALGGAGTYGFVGKVQGPMPTRAGAGR
jgi:Copper transport outer membrane protein, MctB